MSFLQGLIGIGTHLTDGILVQPPASAGYAPAPIAIDAVISGAGVNNAAVAWGPCTMDWGTMQYMNLQDLAGNQILTQPIPAPFAVTVSGNNLVQVGAGLLAITFGPLWAPDLLRAGDGSLIFLASGEPTRMATT